jgi:uncharacterized membrane protein
MDLCFSERNLDVITVSCNAMFMSIIQVEWYNIYCRLACPSHYFLSCSQIILCYLKLDLTLTL